MQLKNLKDQKSEETKAKLLAATKEILEKYGVKHCTVRNICDVSGVSTGSFYHQFGSKENIVNVYMKQLYREAVKKNRPPKEVYEDGFAVDIMWPFLVYSKFCEAIGPEIVKLLFLDTEHDIFIEECKETDALQEPLKEFLLGEDSRYDHDEVIDDIFLDIQTIYRGAVSDWIYSEGKGKRTLSENMEHLLFRFLISFAKDSFLPKMHSNILICEKKGYDSFFNMDFIKIRQ